MTKKSQQIPSETTAWALGIVIIIILFFIFFFPGLMGKLKDTAYAFGQHITSGPKIPKLDLEIPKDLEEKYNKFFDVLEKNREGEGACLLEYDGLSTPKGYNIELFEQNGYSGWIVLLKGKEGGFKTNAKTVGSLRPCIVYGRYFYDGYLGEERERFKDAIKHINADLIINKDKTIFEDRDYDFNQEYLFKSDGHICFFLTHLLGPWGCDASEYTLDNECIREIKKIIPTCGEGEAEWSKILEEYEKNKCKVNKYTCKAENLPCQCFSKGFKKIKTKPEECTAEEPYCYDSVLGCEDMGPDYGNNVEICKETNENFELAPKCEVEKNTCEVKNAPCSCHSEGRKESGRLPLICSEGQYCYHEQEGCLNKGPDDVPYVDLCQKSNPNFNLEEIQECIVDEDCKATNLPCKCITGGGKYEICLEKGDSYCRINSFGCDANPCIK